MKYSDEKIKRQNIVTHSKVICGKLVQYSLCAVSEKEYEISVLSEGTKESASFVCDFFTVVKLLEVVEQTDTLPENIKEIAEDFALMPEEMIKK